MFQAMRAITFWGLLAAIPSAVLSAQGAEPGAQAAGQQKPEGTPPASSGKQEVTSPHEVQLDAQHRVITAGGFVKTGPIVFEDASEKAGLTKWTHKMGTPEKNYIIETKGSGVGLIDYDNDGWLDIYLVNGSTIEALDGQGDTAACRAVSQQPRRNVYRCRGKSRRHQRPLGYWRGHCRL